MATTPRKEYRLLGQKIPYIEGPLKVTGRADTPTTSSAPVSSSGASSALRGPTPVSARSMSRPPVRSPGSSRS